MGADVVVELAVCADDFAELIEGQRAFGGPICARLPFEIGKQVFEICSH